MNEDWINKQIQLQQINSDTHPYSVTAVHQITATALPMTKYPYKQVPESS